MLLALPSYLRVQRSPLKNIRNYDGITEMFAESFSSIINSKTSLNDEIQAQRI